MSAQESDTNNPRTKDNVPYPGSLPDEPAPTTFPASVRGRRQNGNKTRVVEDALRIKRGLELLVAGFTYEEVAEQIGFANRSNAHRSIKRWLDKIPAPRAHELRDIENRRLDRAQAAIWRRVLDGDLAAIDRFLRISARRATLNGLDLGQSVMLSPLGDDQQPIDSGAVEWRQRFASLPVAERQELAATVRRLVGSPEGDRPI